MKISVLQENLSKAASMVSRVVDNRPQLPVLANILLIAEGSRLTLASTNLQTSITCWIGAKVDEPGSITLPAKTFQELVSSLSPERVDLTLDSQTHTIQIQCGATKSHIKGIDADEFPPINHSDSRDVILAGKVFKEMINQTVFAAANDDNRPVLTGVLTEFANNTMTMAAADGYRLAVRTTQIDENFNEPVKLTIPAKALQEVAKAITDEEVFINFPHRRDIITFEVGNVTISSQLIDGRFPDFANIIPRQYNSSTTMYTADLLKACKRAEIFARDSSYSSRIIVNPPQNAGDAGSVKIVGRSQEKGDLDGVIDAGVEGESLDVSFNIKYLIDVLQVIDDERIVFQSNGPETPGVVRLENRDDFVHVIMPMSR
ncbi:DNA polymerase III subunit beta [Anaerolineales bacterium]